MKRGYTRGKNVDFITQAIKPVIPNHCRYVHDRRNEGILLLCDRQRSVASLRKTPLQLPRQEQPTAVGVVLIMASYLSDNVRLSAWIGKSQNIAIIYVRPHTAYRMK